MEQASNKPVKWWQVCIAVIGLVALIAYVGSSAFKPTNQVYSEKIAPGTTPVIEGE
jgi:hypothetical protein